MLPSGCSFDSIDGSRHCRHISLGLCTEHTFPLTFALRVLYAILGSRFFWSHTERGKAIHIPYKAAATDTL
jgi:hypothetical protein